MALTDVFGTLADTLLHAHAVPESYTDTCTSTKWRNETPNVSDSPYRVRGQ